MNVNIRNIILIMVIIIITKLVLVSLYVNSIRPNDNYDESEIEYDNYSDKNISLEYKEDWIISNKDCDDFPDADIISCVTLSRNGFRLEVVTTDEDKYLSSAFTPPDYLIRNSININNNTFNLLRLGRVERVETQSFVNIVKSENGKIQFPFGINGKIFTISYELPIEVDTSNINELDTVKEMDEMVENIEFK